jgi:cysteine synthase
MSKRCRVRSLIVDFVCLVDWMIALNLLQNCVVPGKTKAVVEYSSGSTVLSMSLISRAIHGVDDVRAFLSNKTSSTKLRLMQFFGIDM